MRSWLLAGFVMGIFLLSMTATPQAQTANFQARLIFNSEISYYNGISQVIKQQLLPLLVDVKIEGSPRPVFNTQLSKYDYEMALVSMDKVNAKYPSLWSQFSPKSVTGQKFYRTSSQNVLDTAGITGASDFFQLLDQYKVSSNVAEKQQLAFEIQKLYNSQWLLDIPLISTVDVMAAWPQFEGLSADEGLVNSLFLGAHWTSNPSQRQDKGRTTEELHYAPQNFLVLSNPLFFGARPDFVSLATVYSSAFLVDGQNRIQPNLARSFKHELDGNGSTWTLYLRDDVKWSDGKPLDASDFKFTYDLVTFDWMGTTNQEDWDNVDAVRMLNSTVVQVHFQDNSLENVFKLANQYIVPEHILNKTVTIDGVDVHPYEGKSPAESVVWQNYFGNPVSAGPFTYDAAGSSNDVVVAFKRNVNYWNPSIADTPNHVFNLTSGAVSDPYYFADDSDISINNLIFNVGGKERIDTNTLLNLFTTGNRDVVEFDTLDLDSKIFGDSTFYEAPLGYEGGGMVLLLNPEFGPFSLFDTRKALTQAIDRSELVKLMGMDQLVQGTPVSRYYPSYYDTSAVISHDYSAARDAFRGLGYDALEDNTVDTGYTWPWQRLPLPFIPVLASFAVLAVFRRKR